MTDKTPNHSSNAANSGTNSKEKHEPDPTAENHQPAPLPTPARAPYHGEVLDYMAADDNGLTGIPGMTPQNYPDLFDHEKELDPKAFPQFFKRYRHTLPSTRIPRLQVDDVPNGSYVEPDEYRRRQLDRLFMHQALTNLPADAIRNAPAAQQPFYRSIVYCSGSVYCTITDMFLLPWDTIPEDEPPYRGSRDYRTAVDSIFKKHNPHEDHVSFAFRERWVREYYEKLHYTMRVIGVPELYIFDPDKLNLHPHPEPLHPDMPSAEMIDRRIAEAINSDTKGYYNGPPIEPPTDPADDLPRKIDNAPDGTPAATENKIHDVAYQGICECELTLAALRAQPPTTERALRMRMRDIVNLSKVLVLLRNLHRPLVTGATQPRGRGRPRKSR